MASMQDLPAPTEHDAHALAQKLAVEQASHVPLPTNTLQPERKRRSHQKSRKGCTICKKRKVKCSEERPECAQCHKLDLKCIYAPRDGASSAMPPPILECYLMYFWTTQTGKGFFDSEAWIAHVPDLAFENTYLLHAIFSVTASHQQVLGMDLHSRMPMPVNEFITRHRQKALDEFRDALEKSNAGNVEALFGTAVLLAIQSFLVEPGTWMRMFSGTRFVADKLREHLPGPTIWDRLLIPRLNTPPVPASFTLSPLAKGPLEQPIAHLARLYELDQLTQEEIFAWPALLEDEFLNLLEIDDSAALTVGYWFYSLLRRVDDQIWWIDNYARRECTRINNVLSAEYRPFLPIETDVGESQAVFQ